MFALAFLVIGFQQCLAQTTAPTVLPPNCVCPTRPPMMQQMWTTGTPIIQPGGPIQPVGPVQGPGGNNGMMHGGPRGRGGMMHMRMHGICGNNGQNYTSPCDFVNAKALNTNLGMRPCFLNQMASAMNQLGTSTMRPERQKTVCLSNGQTATSTIRQLNQQLTADSSLGIRCKGTCPCAPLTCPSFHRRGMMQADDDLLVLEVV